jgi:hypothetical protein
VVIDDGSVYGRDGDTRGGRKWRFQRGSQRDRAIRVDLNNLVEASNDMLGLENDGSLFR